MGSASYHHINWDIPSLETGYWLRQSSMRNGVMTEAINALTQYAFKQLHVKRLAIICDTKNLRNKKISERYGETLMAKLLISACLLGQKVRYDGKDNLQAHARLQAMVAAGDVVTICPEMAGGLDTPREPAEIEPGASALDVIQGKAKIITINHTDVTVEYVAGAYKALQLAQQHHVSVAILKARSPSCGSQQVYDGNFSKTLIPGMGVTAALLQQHGIQVFDEDHIDEAINEYIK